MSIRKAKSFPSNLQLVSDKEVATSLERLIDSVVMVGTAQRFALLPQQVNESNDDALGINSLPDEIIEEIFSYLAQNQLGQIARVCRRWNVLTKRPLLWKNVNVKLFFPSDRSQTAKVKSFINTLPSCVISISLNFTKSRNSTEPLHFAEVCVKLHEKCPHLEELVLIHSELSNSLSSIIDLCTQFLQEVKYLIFQDSKIYSDQLTDEYFGISKIKILGFFYCYLEYSNMLTFSKMPHLKQLHLFNTNVDDSWFEDDISFFNHLHVLNLGNTDITAETSQVIQNHARNLKELYLCAIDLEDHEITFNNFAFPHLKTICLIDNPVTCEGVVSLIQSCPSLENVYVEQDVAESFAAHPFAKRCKAGIVKAVDWNHNHDVNYFHN